MKHIYTLLALLSFTTTSQSQTTLFSEDFETGSSTQFNLNTTTLGGTTNDNQWVINNSYTGGSGTFTCLGFPFTFTVPNAPAQPAGITGSPNSYFMHIVANAAVSSGITSPSYIPADGTCVFAGSHFVEMNSDISTVGYSSVELNFWWMHGGSAQAVGEVYYSLNSGVSWTQLTAPITDYFNQATWTQQTITNAAFDNQATLRFAFRFNNATSASGTDPGFSIDDIEVTGTVACNAPVADYSSSTTNLTVLFTDNSTNTPTSWLWDFGDGNTSTMQNPSHTYTVSGNYVVCLTATNSCGSDSSCANISVTCPAPSVGYNHTTNNLSASFMDNSTNTPTSWLWDFGDGNTSTMQNPTHTYATSGNYPVCLTATNACGTDSSCVTVSVGCPTLDSDFSASSTNLNANFTDNSAGAVSSWLWDFGDGNTSTVQSPSHTYASSGSYSVCLTVTDSCGITDSSCQTLPITMTDIDNPLYSLVNIYPNPTTDQWSIQLGDLTGNTTIIIRDIQGRLVFRETMNNQAVVKFNASSPGVYMAEILNGDNRAIFRVVKQ